MKFKNKVKLDNAIRWVGTPQSLVAHSVFFMLMLSLPFFGVDPALSLLILTTVVSLEAIYISIFIQMGVNRHADEQMKTTQVLSDLEDTIDDVQETIEDVQETIDEEMREVEDEN
jgi:hypothetical protein